MTFSMGHCGTRGHPILYPQFKLYFSYKSKNIGKKRKAEKHRSKKIKKIKKKDKYIMT